MTSEHIEAWKLGSSVINKLKGSVPRNTLKLGSQVPRNTSNSKINISNINFSIFLIRVEIYFFKLQNYLEYAALKYFEMHYLILKVPFSDTA